VLHLAADGIERLRAIPGDEHAVALFVVQERVVGWHLGIPSRVGIMACRLSIQGGVGVYIAPSVLQGVSGFGNLDRSFPQVAAFGG
jgi:hypothetical protein